MAVLRVNQERWQGQRKPRNQQREKDLEVTWTGLISETYPWDQQAKYTLKDSTVPRMIVSSVLCNVVVWFLFDYKMLLLLFKLECLPMALTLKAFLARDS